MTNIATQASNKNYKITVLADGSKIKSSSFDTKQKFEIYRFDQLKFLKEN